MEFSLEGWETMSREAKVRRCIQLADQAQKLAELSKPPLSEGFLSLAESYLKLATSAANGE